MSPSMPRTVALPLFLACTVLAQPPCTTVWQPGVTTAVAGAVSSVVTWDPDGSGPATEVLVLAGGFQAIGDVPATNLGTYDPASGLWSGLGWTLTDQISEVVIGPNNDLYVRGAFPGIRRRSGGSWSPVGSLLALPTFPTAMTVRSNGNVIAATMNSTLGTFQSQVHEFDGTTWTTVGAPLTGPSFFGFALGVSALEFDAQGNLIAGGSFDHVGGVATGPLVRFANGAWQPFGGGIPSGTVTSLKRLSNGDLIAGGNFASAGFLPAAGVARWNGATWVGHPGSGGHAKRITALPGGDFAVTFDTPSSNPQPGAAVLRGANWTTLDTGLPTPPLLLTAQSDGTLHSVFRAGPASPFQNLARWNGALWHPLTGGTNGAVTALLPLGGARYVAGGAFTSIGAGVAASRVALWNGGAWSPMGSGFDGQVAPGVSALLRQPNGNIVAGGRFTTAGTVPANNIAEWNGTQWMALGGGVSGNPAQRVTAMASLPNGAIVVGGDFSSAGGSPVNCIATWNGTQWSPLGSGCGAIVRALLVLPNGDVIAGGDFTTAGGITANAIARWDGATWSPLGAGLGSGVAALARLPNGDIVAGGWFSGAGGQPANRVARWNGSTWTALGSGLQGTAVMALQVLPDGDLLAAGEYLAPGFGVARWDGAAWSSVGSGAGHSYALSLLPTGDLVVGGNFAVHSPPATCLAVLRTTCPPGVTSYGAGCIGTGGENQLDAESAPWLGDTFRSRATGMPPNGPAVTIFGFAPIATPLATLLPIGGAGCTALVTGDILQLTVPTAGEVRSTLPIPNAAVLVNLDVHHQVLAVEVDASGTAVEVTSTNALTLRPGTF